MRVSDGSGAQLARASALKPAEVENDRPDAAAHHHRQEADIRRVRDARQRPDLAEHAIVELLPSLGTRRTSATGSAVRSVSTLSMRKPGSICCTRHSARTSRPDDDQQNDRRRDRGDDQYRAQAFGAPPGAGASAVAQRLPDRHHVSRRSAGKTPKAMPVTSVTTRGRPPACGGRRRARPESASCAAPAARRAASRRWRAPRRARRPQRGEHEAFGERLADQAFAARRRSPPGPPAPSDAASPRADSRFARFVHAISSMQRPPRPASSTASAPAATLDREGDAPWRSSARSPLG